MGWGKTKTVVPAHLETEDELLAAPIKHGREAHGDEAICLDCEECLAYASELLAKFRITPEMYLDYRRAVGNKDSDAWMLTLAEKLVENKRKENG